MYLYVDENGQIVECMVGSYQPGAVGSAVRSTSHPDRWRSVWSDPPITPVLVISLKTRMRTIFFCISILFCLFLEVVQAQTVGHDRSVRMWAEVQNEPPAITLKWQPHSNTTGFQIWRKMKGGTSWGNAIASLGSTALEYTDNNVQVGANYEYKVARTTSNLGQGYGYVNVGIRVPMVEHRGTMILIVDDFFTSPLSTQLTQLRSDLEGDGWKVVRHDVSRTAPVSTVKSLIVSTYNADPNNVKAVFLVGHVPVPYSGNLAPDGHGEHMGAWPADVYYGDVNGAWTDATVWNAGGAWPRNHNVPGDGKFDQTNIPSAVELAVGRVDMYDLPIFSGQTEVQLMSNYLTKLSNWKRKVFTVPFRGLVDDNFTGYSDAFSQNAWRGFAPFVHPNNVSSLDYFGTLSSQGYLWSYGCGGGWFTGANGIGNSIDFNTNSVNTVFTFLFGSYFGDWDNQNNFLRCALASGTTLTNIWAGYPNWFLHHMALGETIGYGTVLSQNNSTNHYEPQNWNAGRVHIALMGDPSLRMHIVAPPTNVAATLSGASSVNITWTASAEAVLGYHVYRWSGSQQQWQRITTDHVTGTSYLFDANGLSGTQRFMVRALKLESGFSGSYYNLSVGNSGQVDLNTVPTDCSGVPNGNALPGTPCNDGNPCTLNDTWNANCQCVGSPVFCDDGDPCTSNSCVNGTCIFSPMPDTDGDGYCDAIDACPNDANKMTAGICGCGSPEPGTPCDDGDPMTVGDVIGTNCQCAGMLIDCLGVVGGTALPGSACNDGDPNTGADQWTLDCQCAGLPIDCMGLPGGSAQMGTPCDDGDVLTINDMWTAACECAGTTADCLGIPDGEALPGTPCDDGDPNTGLDTWNVSCGCIGLPLDCAGVPGGGAVVDDCGVCGGTNACIDAAICVPLVQDSGLNPDGEEAESGNIYMNSGALDLVRDSEPGSWRGNQIAAMRFSDVEVPQGAIIINAHVQFSARTGVDLEPCALDIVIQDADDSEPLYSNLHNFSDRPTTNPIHWTPPVWDQPNAMGPAQRTPDLSSIIQQVVDRPGWQAGNAMVVMVSGVGRRTSWSWDQSTTRAPKLCISYAMPPPADCAGVPGGAALPGTPCDDGQSLTQNDTWTEDCACEGDLYDCLGTLDGDALPGTSCDDGDDNTIQDSWTTDCACVGLLPDCLGVPGGPALPGAPCDDGDDTTGADVWTAACECAGVPLDCLGVPGGGSVPGSSCDDGNANTALDTWSNTCECIGVPLDCEGLAGGDALPGTPCDDGDEGTAEDAWSNDCTCMGLVIDCQGVPGGEALPGASCDDGDPNTGDDQWTSDCTCAGAPFDCTGTAGGDALPGSSCDDGDDNTGNDSWTTDCLCAGEPLDCLGEPGGNALPGSPCDDGDQATGNDTWTSGCGCAGEPIDCAGMPGGVAWPGTPCDDGEEETVQDTWTADCTCAGMPVDCNGTVNGTAFIDDCGNCVGGETGMVPDPDGDSDGLLDCDDNCPEVYNSLQADHDGDGVGDVCDNCPWIINPDQADHNGNGIGDVCDEVGITEWGMVPSFMVHPNPSFGSIQFTVDPPEAHHVLVHDPLGALVMDVRYTSVMDLNALQAGTYMLTILDRDRGPIGMVRVVKL